MRFLLPVLAVTWLMASPAGAQPLAENMSCAQAIDYFQRNGVIYKTAHGRNILPIRQGIPIRLAGGLTCPGPYLNRFSYGLRTLDRRFCVISAYCS